MRTEGFARSVESLRERAIENVVDECGFAGPGDAGDDGEQAEGNGDVNVLEIVGGGTENLNAFSVGGAARVRNGDL